jgi:hypothetical protein
MLEYTRRDSIELGTDFVITIFFYVIPVLKKMKKKNHSKHRRCKKRQAATSCNKLKIYPRMLGLLFQRDS